MTLYEYKQASIGIFKDFKKGIKGKTLTQDEVLSILTYHYESTLGRFHQKILWEDGKIVGWKTPWGKPLNVAKMVTSV